MKKNQFLSLLSVISIAGLLLVCCAQTPNPPATPTGVQAVAVSSSSITVSWDSVSSAGSYKLYYGTTPDAYEKAVVTSSGTSYTVTGLSSNTTYYFKVSAIDTNGESEKSAVVSAKTNDVSTTTDDALSAPTGVQAVAVSSSSITVSWDSVSGAVSYKLYYGTTTDVSDNSVVVSSGTSYTVTGLSSDLTYYFKVSAVNSTGESEKSSAVSAVTKSNTASAGKYIKIDSSATTCTLTGLDNNTVYLMKYNPTDTTISAANTGYLTGTSSASAGTLGKNGDVSKSGNSISGMYQGGIVRYDNRKAQEFNANPPPRGSSSAWKRSADIQKTESYNVGSTRKFWVQNASNAWQEVSATLRATGTYCYVWVVDDNYDNSSTSTTDEKITMSQAAATASKFDTVYPLETAVFGAKYSDSDQTTNLVAPADKISILAYDIDYDYSSSQTGGTFGFFWAKDMYSDSYMTSVSTNRSNETEMFYVDAYFLDYVPNMMYSTLAHEFQHMLHFVHKSVEKSLSSSTWYNEMLSMLCEDMMQSTLGMTDAESPKGRLPYFNYDYYAGITSWYTGNGVYISYANAYAFGAYLVRNYGGAALVHELATNSFVDMDSITAAIQAEAGHSDETAKSAFLKYGQALVYTDSTSAETHPSFNKSVTATVGGYSFTFSAIDLCSYKENDGTTTYTGPVIYSAASDGKTDLHPWGFSVHKAGTYSGDIMLNLSSRSSNEIVYVLVK